MALPPLATVDFYEEYANVELDEGETIQVGHLLAQASAIVRAFANRTWVDDPESDTPELEDVPDGVDGIVAGMVRRATANPGGATGETTGPFTVNYGAGAAERLYLTATDKLILRGGPTAFTIDSTPAASPLHDDATPESELVADLLTELPDLEGAVINFPEEDESW